MNEFETRARASATPEVVVQAELCLPHVGWTRFATLVVEAELPHLGRWSWATQVESLDQLRPHAVTTSRSDDHGSAALLDLRELAEGEAWAYVKADDGHVYVVVAASTTTAVEDVRRWLLERLPEASPLDGRVPISFWARTCNGGYAVSRMLDVPSWEEIAGNYPSAVAERLEPFLRGRLDATANGRLVLWHGVPGMGKTYVLRALAWEWREWCSLHYVTDPEEFFGSSEYMLDVLLDDDEGERWRLLVLEDTGELLTADAKERTGQGLSRFLNVVDGILGQGLRAVVLVTTNEPVRRLHPAVARPGRCLAEVEFVEFGEEEARAWLAARGVAVEGGVPRTLAALFAAAAGDPRPEQEVRRVGFVG